MLIGVGASTCASGSHECSGTIGTFTAKPRNSSTKKRYWNCFVQTGCAFSRAMASAGFTPGANSFTCLPSSPGAGLLGDLRLRREPVFLAVQDEHHRPAGLRERDEVERVNLDALRALLPP